MGFAHIKARPLVCTQEDDFTRGRFLTHPRWVVRLSDGTSVISDDERPGTDASAWQRLRRHVEATGLGIESVELQFRSHVERPVPNGAAAYFFKFSAGGFPATGETHNYFLVGHVAFGDDKVLVQRWLVPALVKFEEEWRDLGDDEKVGAALIWNRNQ